MRLFYLVLMSLFALCTPKLEAAHSELPNSSPLQTDLSYAKHIDVECYIVTRQQLSDLLSQKEKNITQLSAKELYHLLCDVYFLIRVKNNGNMAASGMLHCFVRNCGYPFPIKIMKLPPKMEDYYDFVLRFDTGLIFPTDPKPLITYEWNKLDCYPHQNKEN